MSFRKPLAVVAGVTAAFAIGTAANAASLPIAPPDVVGIPAGTTCPTSYGMPNAATGSCLPWCELHPGAPCIPMNH